YSHQYHLCSFEVMAVSMKSSAAIALFILVLVLPGRADQADKPEPLLRAPVDFALDAQGRIYVADSIARGGIFRFDDMTGKGAAEIGIGCSPSDAQKDCSLEDPHSIFVDAKDRIYTADATGRIVVLDPESQHWTSLPSASGNVPRDLFVDAQARIYATYDDGALQMNNSCKPVNSLSDPQSIFVDSAKRVYVADTGNDRVVRIDANCKADSLGVTGSGVKQFHEPRGIAVDSQGRIYVADSGNHRIVRMDDWTGAGWVTFGKYGTTTGELSSPRSIVLDSQGRICIGDFGNGRIVRIDDMSGTGWTALLLRRRTRAFSEPVDVAADANQKLYVADRADGRILRIDNRNGEEWTDSQKAGVLKLRQPSGIFAAGGLVTVADSESRMILQLSESLQPVREISTAGFLVEPRAVYVDAQSRIFLTDSYDQAVARLDDPTDPGKKDVFWGSPQHKFDHPSGIFVDPAGRIYIADTFNRRIVRMDDLQGKNWNTLPWPKSEDKGIWPVDVSLDSAGRIYILDGERCRIIRVADFSGKGRIDFGSEGFGNRQFFHPSAIFLDSTGRIYVADTGNRRIVRIDDLTGKGWVTWGESQTQIIRFTAAHN
ncbi:MAG TPA: NHL repeat-containing protein, partial [Acidobacteriota bacterium]|nr:NHL repeat-containing protein [Acidobacteriota bacterium]